VSFRAGDVVLHRPTGETWVLAIDSENGRVSWAGWPEGMAAEADCDLVRAATDEERVARLEESAKSKPGRDGGPDHRASAAQRQLADDDADHLEIDDEEAEQS